MSEVVYRVVEHDGGWAYKAGDVFSETFRSREGAMTAARRVAAEQRRAGDAEPIEWEDADGVWHSELSSGDDRPTTRVAE